MRRGRVSEEREGGERLKRGDITCTICNHLNSYLLPSPNPVILITYNNNTTHKKRFCELILQCQ